MVSQGQQGETSGADDQASQNKQQTEQSGEASQRKQSAQLHVSPQSSADDVQFFNDSTKLDQSDSLASLGLEIEIQDLIDRVSILERGHAAILNVQKSILQNRIASYPG